MLLEIARNLPEKDVDLGGYRSESEADPICGAGKYLAAIKRGVEAPLVKREQAKRPNDAMLKRLDKLKNWRKTLRRKWALSQILSCQSLFEFSCRKSAERACMNLKSLMADSPWRFSQYGEQIYRLLGG